MSIKLKKLRITDLDVIVDLARHLNPELSLDEVRKVHQAVFDYDSYTCFGLVKNEKIIGVCGLWKSIKTYSGLQFEIDHLVVDPKRQSEGLGHQFVQLMEEWAKTQGAQTLELNTYTENKASHKFYHREDFIILGFHFQKKI